MKAIPRSSRLGKRTRFLTGAPLQGASVLAIAMLLAASPAWAQATESPTASPPKSDEATAADEDVVVTGFRGSLLTAQEIKRNSDTIVDSISADDIGALPDRSVTEALQRVPGITINRFRASNDPDHFSAEGSNVLIRGLTYVRSEFNGRDAFSSNNGRTLGFADVPAELVGGVDVFKSVPADHIEGGIAGTVDLKTHKPFDQKEAFIAATIQNSYGDFVGKSAPSGSVVASYRTSTPIGEIGILGSFSTSKLYSRSDRINVFSFQRRCAAPGMGADTISGAPSTGTDCPAGTANALIPGGAGAASETSDRTRNSESLALQWRSTDGSLEATFQFLRSDAREAWTEHDSGAGSFSDNNGIGSVPEDGTAFGFDPNGVFTNGFLTSGNYWSRADQWSGTGRSPVETLGGANIRRDYQGKFTNTDYSANLKWQVSDRLTATFDYQHATSKTEIDDNGLWNYSYEDVAIKLNGASLPTIAYLPPQDCSPGCIGGTGSPSYYTGEHQNYLDPFNSFAYAAMDHAERSSGHENAARLDLKYDIPGDGFLDSVKAGYRFSDRRQTARSSVYNWGVLSDQWGNGGPLWLDNPVTQQGAGYEVFGFDNFFGGAISAPAAPGRLFYAGNTVADYAGYAAYAKAVGHTWQSNGSWLPLAERTGVVPGTMFLPGETNPANERNNAAYVMLNFGQEFGARRLSGNIGLRYSRTNRTAFGGTFFGTSSTDYATQLGECSIAPPGGMTNLSAFCRLPSDVQNALVASDTGTVAAFIPSTAHFTYDYWLPSANLKLDLGNGLLFRAAYFKGVAPPDFGITRNYTQINQISVSSSANVNNNEPYLSGSVGQGNPYLRPVTADSYDLTAEYYFGQGGQLTASLFYKRLKGVVTSEAFSSTVQVASATAFINGSQPVNSSDTGTVKGFEISYHQSYSFLPGFLSGFGLQANYTYVDSSGVPQSTLNSSDTSVAAGNISNIPGVNFPLEGLSTHTFNIVPYYEKGPLSVRVAYNWRSKYLLTLRDNVQPYAPIFQHANGSLDASIDVTVNEHLRLGIAGTNLLDSIIRTSAAVYDQQENIVLVPRSWYKRDRSFTVSAHLNF